jgi:hypothetical protein
VLTDDNLTRLPQAIDLARSSLALVHQSIGIVTLPNALGLGLATVGAIGPAMATALNNGSAIVAGLNALRPLLIDESPRNKDEVPSKKGETSSKKGEASGKKGEGNSNNGSKDQSPRHK